MKKIFCFFVVLLAVTLLAACTGKHAEQSETEAPVTETANATRSPAENLGTVPTSMPTEAPTPEAQKDPYDGFASEKTRKFTKEEKFINDAYHALFPDRTDYIAFWKDTDGEEESPLFWAPESVAFPSDDYTLYSSCRYEWIDRRDPLSDERGTLFHTRCDEYLWLFVDYAADSQTQSMYAVSMRSDGTIKNAITIGTARNYYGYFLFESRSEAYLAVECGYAHNIDQDWNSLIIDLKDMKIVWSEDSWYDAQGVSESSNDLHKLLLSGKGFTVYERVPDSENPSVKYEETGFLFFEEILHSEKTRNFTEKEALLNAAYHAVFPDRDNYIAYWEYDDAGSERIFWAPDGQNCVQEGYVHNRSIRYEWIERGGMYVFVVVDAQWSAHPTEMHVAFVRPDGTLAAIVSDYGENHYEYRMLTVGGAPYLAVESGYVHQGYEYWNSFIVSLNEMKIVWDEKEWYENFDGCGPDGRGVDRHKLLLSEDGFTVYYTADGHFYKQYEEIGFLSFAELLG